MKKITLLFILVFVAFQVAFSQGVSFKRTITVSAGGTTIPLVVGVNGDGAGPIVDNTIGYDKNGSPYNWGGDPAYQDVLSPPAPPDPYFLDARLLTPPPRLTTLPLGLGGGAIEDYRGFSSSSQVDTFYVQMKGHDDAGTDNLGPVTVTWPSDLGSVGTSWMLVARTGATFTPVDMIADADHQFVITPTVAGPVQVYIIKTGAIAPAAVRFDVSPASLVLGTATPGQVFIQTVTVTNGGSTTNLSISAPLLSGAVTGISPSGPVTLIPGQSQPYTVTVTAPGFDGPFTGNIHFDHNATPSSNDVPVSGTVSANNNKLAFGSETPVTVWDNSKARYRDSLQILGLQQGLKAIQFDLFTNGKIILRSVRAGTQVPADKFAFAAQITRGQVEPDGSTKDSVRILIYGKNPDDTLAAGSSYNSLVHFEYDVVNQGVEHDSTTISVRNITASMFNGTPISISLKSDRKILIENRSLPGDINNDDAIDIIDILMIVDHITGRSVLPDTGGAPTQFDRADIAPWPAGNGVVDVQDLTLLQNIILTKTYPAGGDFGGETINRTAPSPIVPVVPEQIASLNKLSGTAGTQFKIYVTANGIALHVNNTEALKGFQVDFDNVGQVPANLKIYSQFGEGFAFSNNGSLRLLVYDVKGGMLEAGDRMVVNIPFTISAPERVTLDGIVAGDKDNSKVSGVSGAVSNSNSPAIPLNFELGQNYPNPFNPSTTLRVGVPERGDVSVRIFNLLGQEVRTLFQGQLNAGFHTMQWNGRDNNGQQLSTGTYIVRMVAGAFAESKKMMLLK